MNNTRNRRLSAAVAGAVAATVFVAGCGAADGGGGGGGSTSQEQLDAAKKFVAEFSQAPTTIDQKTPLPAPPAKGKKMVYISDPVPANILTSESVEQAVTSAGWEYERLTYDVANPASIQAALRTALTKGADYVGEAGTDPQTFGDSIINEYRQAGAKIIAGSTYPEQNSDVVNTDPTSGPDRENQAKALANWFIADSEGKGKAIVENVTAYPVLALFATSFKKYVEENCSGCSVEIMGFDPSTLQDGSLIPSLVSKLRTDKDAKYVFFDYAAFSTGIDSALSAAGLDDVKVGGIGMDTNAAEGIRKGTQDAWVATNFPYAGYAIADVAFRLDAKTDAGLDQDRTGPIQLFTKDNISSYSGDFRSPTDALAQLQALWQVAPVAP